MIPSRPVLFLTAIALLVTPAGALADFDLNFATNPSLPSAQGLTYQGNVSETQAYKISGGLLHLDTIQFGSDVGAYYHVANGFDHTFDAEMRIYLRVSQYQMNRGFGVLFGFYDTAVSDLVNVTPTGWSVYSTSSSGTFTDPTAFHLIDLKSYAATNTYTLSVDGVQVATGTRPGGFTGPDVYFGDGTTTGGNLIADIGSVDYSGHGFLPPPTSLPEPTGLALASLGTGLMGLTAALRQARGRVRAWRRGVVGV